MIERMHLETPRLLLREFHADDLDAVHAFAADPEVIRFTDWGPNTVDDTAAFLAEATHDAGARPRTRFALAVLDRAAQVLIGSVELSVTSAAHRQGSTGYVLARPWWGQGRATEAATAMLRLGFDRLDLHKISATCDPGNIASGRVLTKIGMRREGHLHDHLYVRGRWRDRLLFAAITDAGGVSSRSGTGG
ncbi:GNAT family N-acetyltransferase [Krasilnikovia sp. M28-CT-15]|uniref:GNAT family N-acetyltransferase n=1 Tax=Krasilnikovia sp. M28-CT-15 TaxID=3373540 RepID=UPI0038766FB3